MRPGALAGLITLRTRFSCWKPPRKKSWRLDRSPFETPNDPRSASTWCQGTPRVLQGSARYFDANAVACQKEKSLPSAGSETRSEREKRWPISDEMLRTKRRASEYDQVSVAAASNPGEVGTLSGLRSTLRFSSEYDNEISCWRSTCENGNAASIDPPSARS